jgi:hypothetical protein
MFNVTDAATAFMAEELDRRETPARVIRFWHDTHGLHLRLSDVHPDDKSFAHHGRTVFVVDEDLAQRLAGRKLDLKHTVDGTKLALAEIGLETGDL